MENRRNFLKLFGIGTAIVPFVGGELVKEATAKLIEIPKVELIQPSLLPEMRAVSGSLAPDMWPVSASVYPYSGVGSHRGTAWNGKRVEVRVVDGTGRSYASCVSCLEDWNRLGKYIETF